MKIIKPLKLGLLFRIFEHQGRNFWSPAVLIFFDFSGPPQVKPEVDLWKFVSNRLGPQEILDQGMPKGRGEILVNGSFFAPGGKPVPSGKVRIKFTSVDKTLYVFGNRYWKRSVGLGWTISDPELILEVPIDWAHAFGGPDYKLNPLGKGMVKKDIQGEGKVVSLPNVELPSCLISSPKDRPPPAGFGPLDSMWPQRFSKAGTFDDQWFEKRFPGLPDDIDWTFFNAAPEDQQIDGFFSGQEDFVVEGMHPEHPRIESKLPAIRPRCFICRQGKPHTEALEELRLRLDTIWLFPDAFKGSLIYRGLTEIVTDTAKDIEKVILAYENIEDERRDLEHYRRAVARRTDPQKAGAALLDESDLIPEGETSGVAEIMKKAGDGAQPWEQLLQKKQKLRMEEDLKRVRDQIAIQGLDPNQVLPLPEPAEYDLTNIEKLIAEAEKARQKADEVLAGQLQQMGLTREQFLEQARQAPISRPIFSASQAIEAFRSLGIEGEAVTKKMETLENVSHQTYCQYGHLLPPVVAFYPQTDSERIQVLLDAYQKGRSLAGMDLSGLDLSGVDLSGANLAGAYLEGAKLCEANLSATDLSGCALMRADLSGAQLSGAILKSAGLGRAHLSGANLSNADLTEATLAEANLTGANFKEAILNKADLSQTVAVKTDFNKATLRNARFIEADFSETNLTEADLSEGLFFKTALRGADLSRCLLVKAILVKVDATAANFRQSLLENLRVAADCILEKACFDQARMEGVNLRGARLAGASFDQAHLNGSDLSETDLKQSSFYHAIAKNALFIEADLSEAQLVGANLFEALLHRANLHKTNFQGSNLYGVDFMKARFYQTDMRQALTARSTLDRWMPR